MRADQTDLPALVVAAQRGERWSMEELVSLHLPFVYTIVRRALGGHPDTDDVVQEVVLRVVRDLTELRKPESFRSWLAAIAIRQVGAYVHRHGRMVERMVPLESMPPVHDTATNVEGLAVLRMELSSQRTEAMRASVWLDADDRSLLALWWVEYGGSLTRAELARALGITVPHAAVRVQRMRGQFERCRSVVAALEAQPQCRGLAESITGWDGIPSPVWRKRIGRHIRGCRDCTRSSADRMAVELLFQEAVMLVVPAILAAAVRARVRSSPAWAVDRQLVSSTTPHDTAIAAFTKAVNGHPAVAILIVATLVLGAVAAVFSWPGIPSDEGVPRNRLGQPVVEPTNRPSPSLAGPASIEAANAPGSYISITSTFGVLAPVTATSDSQLRRLATFDIVDGLSDTSCLSFRVADGRYLRHSSWRLRVFVDDGTPLFRGDSTFCVRLGAMAGSVSLESANYPGWFLRHHGDELWVERSDATTEFATDTSFRIRPPLG